MNHHCRIKSVRLKCLPGFVYTGDFERGNVQAHALMSSGRSTISARINMNCCAGRTNGNRISRTATS